MRICLKKTLEWRVCFDGEGDLIEGTFTKLFHKCQILWICSCSDIIVELALSLLGDRQKGTIVKEPKHVRNYALSWKQVKQLLKKKPNKKATNSVEKQMPSRKIE